MSGRGGSNLLFAALEFSDTGATEFGTLDSELTFSYDMQETSLTSTGLYKSSSSSSTFLMYFQTG